MATTAVQKLETVAATLAGAGIGFAAAGPVGAGVGLAAGALIDALRAKFFKPAPPPVVIPVAPIMQAAAMPPLQAPPPPVQAPPIVQAAMTGVGLPAGANMDAANRLYMLLHAAVSSATPQYLITPARTWLKQFQTSVGLPATGSLDPQSLSMAALAAPGLSSIPANVIAMMK